MSILTSSDSALVAQTLADRPAAFEKLVLRYQRRAYAIARAFGVSSDSLDDVVQEAFLQAFCGLQELRSPASFGAWFLNIVRNLSRGHLRRSKRAPFRASADLDSLEGPSIESADTRDLSDHLQREVARLPEPIREAIFLYYYEGASVRRVSQTLAISHSAVKSRLKRGRDALREKLWRKFEESVREMLPSAREWKRKGRKLALFLMASVVPRHATLAASEAHAGSTITRSLSTYTAAGAFLMSMKKLIVVLVLATLVGTGLVFLTDSLRSPDAVRLDPDEPVAASVEPTAEGKAPIARQPVGPSTGVAGTVYYGDSLAPAPGIHVAAIVDGTREHVEVTITDQDGKYVLARLRPRQYRLFAWRGEWTTRWSPGDVVGVQAKKLIEGADITLVPGVIVQGQVVEERTERAIEGVNVSAHFQSVTTDEEGRFSLEGVPEGLIDVSAEATGFARHWLLVDVAHGEEPFVTVKLAPGGVVEGTVMTWEGEPAAGVEVRASGEGGTSSAHTDAGGHYRIKGMPLTSHHITLSASRGGYFAAEKSLPGFSSGETRLVADLALEEGYVLRGHVMDSDGQPVSGAKLHVLGWGNFSMVLESDDEGRFVIEGASDRVSILTVRKKGYAPASVDLRSLPSKARESIELVLASGHTVSGMVVDSEGAPIEDAFVCVDAAMRDAGPAHCSLTDRAGRFRTDDLPMELRHIGASKSGYASSRWNSVEADQTDIRLVLDGALHIKGVVVDSATNDPVHPFIVRVSGRGVRSSLSRKGVPFDFADGSFSIRNWLTPGVSYRLVVVADGYAEAELSDVEAWSRSVPHEPVRVSLKRGEILRGRVVAAATRQPLRHVRVGLGPEGRWDYWSAYGQRGVAVIRMTVTDEAGEFTIRGLSKEPGVLLLEKNGYARTAVIRVRPTDDAQVFELPPAAAIEGKVRDAMGNPLSGAKVRVLVNDQWFPEITTNDSGAYRVVHLPAGTVELRLSRNGMFEIRRTATLTSGEVTTVDFMQFHGSITGRVTDGGNPVALARILVKNLADLGEKDWIDADQHGIFRVGGLAEGSYELEAWDASGSSFPGVTRTVNVAGEEVRCDISLSPTFVVRGQVIERLTGTPVYGSTITLFRYDSDSPESGGAKVFGSRWVPSGHEKMENDNNRFSLEIPTSGVYFVVAGASGEKPLRGWFGPVEIRGSETDDLTVRVGGSGGVLLDVRDAKTGTPIQNALVRLRSAEGYPTQLTTRTDSAGQARVENVPPGSYRLEVDSKKYGLYEETLELSDSPVTRTLSLRPASWLVVHLQGSLHPGRAYSVRATAVDGDDPGWHYTSRDGNQAMTGANCELVDHGGLGVRLKTRPGTYRIRLDVGAGRYLNSPTVFSQEREISLPEGRESEVTLVVTDR